MQKKTKIALAGTGLVLVAGLAAGIAGAAQRHHNAWQDGEGGMYGGFGHGRYWWHDLTKDKASERARARFAKIDKNSDGIIDASEIEDRLTKRWGKRRARWAKRWGAKRWQRKLARMDTNQDERISKAEFDAQLNMRFARIDLNNDGRISDDDLPPMLRDRGLLGSGGANAQGMAHGPMHRFGRRHKGRKMHRFMMLLGADSNGDGAVGKDEFMAVADKRFARMDKTGDRFLDKQDREARTSERRAYWTKRFIHRFGAEADAAGKITREQFQTAAMQRFSRWDLNNDGTVTRDEMPRRKRMWRRGRRGEDRGGHRGMMRHDSHEGGMHRGSGPAQ